jgi:hypothetical protein
MSLRGAFRPRLPIRRIRTGQPTASVFDSLFRGRFEWPKSSLFPQIEQANRRVFYLEKTLFGPPSVRANQLPTQNVKIGAITRPIRWRVDELRTRGRQENLTSMEAQK